MRDLADQIHAKLEAARSVARSLAEQFPVDCVYVGGSLTADLGNATSDADVFAILQAGEDVTVTAQQLKVGPHRVDVEWYRFEHPGTVLEDLLSVRRVRDDLQQLWHIDEKLDFICRLATAEVVIGSSMLDAVRARLTECSSQLRRLLASRWGLEINTHLEDYLGACLHGDFDTGLHIGQAMMTAAGKALAAAGGDYYFGRRWVYRQLERTAGKTFPMDAFRLFQTGAWVEDGWAGGEALIGFAQTMGAAAQLIALNGVEPEIWPGWRRGDRGLFRSPHYLLFGLDDGLVLHRELRKQFVLRPHVALVWAMCNGVAAAEVAAAAAQLCGSIVGEDLTTERASSVLEKLVARGLVTDHPEPVFAAP